MTNVRVLDSKPQGLVFIPYLCGVISVSKTLPPTVLVPPRKSWLSPDITKITLKEMVKVSQACYHNGKGDNASFHVLVINDGSDYLL